MFARKGISIMEVQCVAAAQPCKENKGKLIGAGLGTAAGVAYNVHDGKKLVDYIGRNLAPIQKNHPNITGTYKDVFQSYLKTNSQTGKKGIIFLKNKTQMAKRAGVMGAVVAGCAAAGLILGAVADKIKETYVNKKANI